MAMGAVAGSHDPEVEDQAQNDWGNADIEGDQNQVNQLVEKSQNQVAYQLTGSWKNGRTRNLTNHFWPYFLVGPESYWSKQEVPGFYKKILVEYCLLLVGYSFIEEFEM